VTLSQNNAGALCRFTEFTEAVSENVDGISKHRLSPENAINYYFLLSFRFQYSLTMRY